MNPDDIKEGMVFWKPTPFKKYLKMHVRGIVDINIAVIRSWSIARGWRYQCERIDNLMYFFDHDAFFLERPKQ